MKFDLPIHHTFEFKGTDMELQLSSYPDGSPKVTIISYEEGPYASLGKPSFPVLEGDRMVLDDSLPEYKEVIHTLIGEGIFSATNAEFSSGYKNYGVYHFLGIN